MDWNKASAVETATRIAAGDDRTNYDWATLALVLGQFALAETWGWYARPTTKPAASTTTNDARGC